MFADFLLQVARGFAAGVTSFALGGARLIPGVMDEMEDIAERLKDEFPVLPLGEAFATLIERMKNAEISLRITSAF